MQSASTICLLLLPVAIVLANVLPTRDAIGADQSARSCPPHDIAPVRSATREPHSPTITAGVRN